MSGEPALLAVSDLHVDHEENRGVVDALRPGTERDWLIVGGDVATSAADVEWALGLLRERFELVIWAPGNHELQALPREGDRPLRGERRYLDLVERCRRLGVVTPEDEFPVWEGAGGPARIAPLFVLYDYSFGRNIAPTREEALRLAYEAGVVCTDEFLLHPDPYPSRQAWCDARVEASERRLAAAGDELPVVLVNHFPLLDQPTRWLRHPEFAQWCGTVRTAAWHRRFAAAAVVYGHLHIPRTSWHDGVRFEEVSLGYPQERRRRPQGFAPRPILPGPADA
jgi:3',5'-cyclic AMP phosphodiesterase CpdA